MTSIPPPPGIPASWHPMWEAATYATPKYQDGECGNANVVYVDDFEDVHAVCDVKGEADHAHIIAASPDRLLALLRDYAGVCEGVRVLGREVRAWRETNDSHKTNYGFCEKDCDECAARREAWTRSHATDACPAAKAAVEGTEDWRNGVQLRTDARIPSAAEIAKEKKQ